ncbi:MAG: ribonuclease HII [Rickettsiales bacterium]|jgi:ribonuclease HII|nr:ribonuclease HII [Rickettsiales bacterium]
MPDFSIENQYKNKLIIGCDEVGRGCLAGPVLSAIAMVSIDAFNQEEILQIQDSKLLSKKQREKTFKIIKEKVANKKIFISFSMVENSIIDKINILEATKLSMLNAYQNFCCQTKIYPNIMLVDGNFKPFSLRDNLEEIKPIIKGDQISISIATASIIAKETRDNIMKDYHIKFPQFDWKNNMGYATKNHLQALKESGFSYLHRISFEPIKSISNDIKAKYLPNDNNRSKK